MKRKELNETLRDHGFQRSTKADEYGDHVYFYTHPDLEGVEVRVTLSEVALADSSWTYTKFRPAVTLLVGAVASGQSGEEFLEVWSTLIERW